MQLTYAGQVFLVVVAVLMIWSFVLTKFWVKPLAKIVKVVNLNLLIYLPWF